MSYQRALSAIHLQGTDRIAHQENLDHPTFMRELIGYDPWTNPLQAYVDAYKALDVDWIFGLPKRHIHFKPGESSKEGNDGVRYTEWGLSGSSWREEYSVHTVEDVLLYDPEAVTSRSDIHEAIRQCHTDQATMGDAALVSGLYYTTLFQFPIMTFGWELFLTAAAAEPDRFQRVLEGFAEVSKYNLTAWSHAGADVIFLHDDVAMERGLVFHPKWYRKRLFPLYEVLLEPLKSHGNTCIAFVSDGDYTPLLDDLVALGFDGFIINANMDLAEIARRIGKDHFLIGNISTSILTFGTRDDVYREVKRCINEGQACSGHIIKATADLPHNIPLDNIRTYFSAAAELSSRN
jgi:Uroporphyrinogen decarboxylase (URO-D)